MATVLDVHACLVANTVRQYLAGYRHRGRVPQDLRILPRDFDQHGFYDVGRRIEPETEGQAQHLLLAGLRIVGDHVARQRRVGQHQQVVFHRAQVDGTPADLHNPAALVADGNEVADREGALKKQGDAGHQVAEGFLQRKAEHDRADAQRGDQAA